MSATNKRAGQVSPQVILIAAACAGLWYGGYYTVKGAKWIGKKAEIGVHKVFQKHHITKKP